MPSEAIRVPVAIKHVPDIGGQIEFRTHKSTQIWRLGRICSLEFLNGKLQKLTVESEGRRFEVPFRKSFWRWPVQP